MDKQYSSRTGCSRRYKYSIIASLLQYVFLYCAVSRYITHFSFLRSSYYTVSFLFGKNRRYFPTWKSNWEETTGFSLLFGLSSFSLILLFATCGRSFLSRLDCIRTLFQCKHIVAVSLCGFFLLTAAIKIFVDLCDVFLHILVTMLTVSVQ